MLTTMLTESRAAEPVFVFPGQGGQWAGMAADLYRAHEDFSAHLDACADALAPYVGWSPIDVLRGSPGAQPLVGDDVIQPVLFAVMVALARFWQSLGVRPRAVVGQSIGEIAAAHVAGALSLADAARVVALRSRALAALNDTGGMAVIAVPADEARIRLTRWGSDRLAIAGHTSPRSTVVSGDRAAIAELLAECTAAGERAQVIPIGYASHSPRVSPIRTELRAGLSAITPHPSDIPFYSTLTGELLDTSRLTAEYWYASERQPMLFRQAIAALAETGHRVFVECSPHPVLTMSVQETLDDVTGAEPTLVVGTLRRGEDGWARLVSTAEELRSHGVPVSLSAVSPGRNPRVPARVAVTGPGNALAEMVRTSVATVTGELTIDMNRTFSDLGFDSAAAVEFCARLKAATGLPLPAGLVFSHPTPAALIAYLRGDARDDRAPVPAVTVTGAGAGAVADEPIAIVGMSCRFPGDVTSPEQLWQVVSGGRHVTGEFPLNRGWDIEHLYDADPLANGKCYVRSGGFLYDADRFDPEFFGISPREALAMDPQQRIMLELSWEAFERTGVDPAALRGRRVGVFVGAMAQDYGPRLHEPPPGLGGYLLTGSTPSVISGRIAYCFGLEGPSVTIDTACSSSLVALHLAGQALRLGECELALAGGITILANPGIIVEFSRQRGLAVDGKCKPFAAAADGTAWAEGAGLVVLERLSDARRNNHRVLAVVRGSAINSDGASNGLASPNGRSQERVSRQALARSGLAPGEVDALEAHGTGTRLGDPIEAEALMAVYGRDRPPDRPAWLGSLKSNIGHTQAAAGIGGVIKMVMAMRHGLLPRTLHVDEPTPHVDWSGGAISLLTEAMPWPQTGRPRRAAVSSFGISGTNAHLILEQAPEPLPCGGDHEAAADGDPGPVLNIPAPPWVLSARSPGGLRAQAARLLEFVAERPEAAVADVARTLLTARSLLEHRAVLLGPDRADLLHGLGTIARGDADPSMISGLAQPVDRIVFVFPGQGSQWPGMAAGLMRESAVFAVRMRECEQALAPHVDWSLTQVLDDADALGRVDVVQPALFAVMVSLAALWESAGVRPAAVAGHSQGEIAAACVAGMISLEQAARIVALRSKTLTALAGHGAMAALALPEEQAARRLRRSRRAGRGLSIAVVNGPDAVVVAGDPAAVAELAGECEADGIRARILPVDYASHSAHVDAVKEPLLESLGEIRPARGRIPFISSATARYAEPERLDARYWYRNLREPVRFHHVIRALLGDGFGAFLEVSPHPVLTMAIEATVRQAGAEAVVLGTLQRESGGAAGFLTAAARALVHGIPVDRQVLSRCGPGSARVIDLPTYPFQGERYWLAHGPASRARAPIPAVTTVTTADSGSRSPQRAGERVRTIAALPGPQQRQALIKLVSDLAGQVLGHQDGGRVDPRRPFRHAGFDSLATQTLCTQLSTMFGRAFPAALVFDHPTPARLAEHLHRHVESGDTRTAEPGTSSAETPATAGNLSSLFRHAVAEGRFTAFMTLTAELAGFRPCSADTTRLAGTLRTRVLRRGRKPVLVCCGGPTAVGTAYEFDRLAAAIPDREVLELPLPGGDATSVLPATLEAVLDAQATVLARHDDDAPVILCGHSAGAAMASALACRLSQQGRPPAGLVLLDIYTPGDLAGRVASWQNRFAEWLVRQEASGITVDDARLTAMAHYYQNLAQSEPAAAPVPTLLVRAAEPLGPWPDGMTWRSVWPYPHDCADAAGNHFTMMTEHAASTARAIDQWIGSNLIPATLAVSLEHTSPQT